MNNNDPMTANDLQSLIDYLPETVLQMGAAIGWENTAMLINLYGGAQLSVARGLRKGHERWLRILENHLPPAALKTFMQTFGGESALIIPRCDLARRERRNRQFIGAVSGAISAGQSKRMALIVLCPRFGIGNTLAWKLLRQYGTGSHTSATQTR